MNETSLSSMPAIQEQKMVIACMGYWDLQPHLS